MNHRQTKNQGRPVVSSRPEAQSLIFLKASLLLCYISYTSACNQTSSSPFISQDLHSACFLCWRPASTVSEWLSSQPASQPAKWPLHIHTLLLYHSSIYHRAKTTNPYLAKPARKNQCVYVTNCCCCCHFVIGALLFLHTLPSMLKLDATMPDMVWIELSSGF